MFKALTPGGKSGLTGWVGRLESSEEGIDSVLGSKVVVAVVDKSRSLSGISTSAKSLLLSWAVDSVVVVVVVRSEEFSSALGSSCSCSCGRIHKYS